MTWKYLIKVSVAREIRVDSWQELLEELAELAAEGAYIIDVFDHNGKRVTV